MAGEFSEKVWEVLRRVPRGCVTTYGQVARLIGSPRSARYVGYALRNNPEPGVLPCHRVIFKDGRICEGYMFGGPDVQRRLLEEEGVTFIDEMHVDMDRHLWDPSADAEGRPTDIDWAAEMEDEF